MQTTELVAFLLDRSFGLKIARANPFRLCDACPYRVQQSFIGARIIIIRQYKSTYEESHIMMIGDQSLYENRVFSSISFPIQRRLKHGVVIENIQYRLLAQRKHGKRNIIHDCIHIFANFWGFEVQYLRAESE